ncbi:MAG: lipopolysaccharide biosynthesis protein [Clostridia bacterium]|nr:lipopolysaccharide biosynthesis protein [Clostridia bacterium]
MIWRYLERLGAQGVSFLVSLVLARLLDPTVYGTVALVTVFNTILQVFVDSGFGNALIQKKDADDLDFSTVFFFNVAACSVLYLVMFFAAPFIAAFYENEQLTPLVRVVSLTLVISGVKNVQQAYVSRHLQFKKFFFATLGGTLGAAVLGIWMAFRGYGVWALVAQNLFNQTVDTLILWITVKWRPKWMFSFKRLKALFSYGWKLLVSSLLNTTYTKIRQLIIGKVYTEADLAFYNKGDYFPHNMTTNINTTIDSVLFPVMAKEQDDRENVKAMVRRAIKTSTYILAPVLLGLAAVATPLVRLLLTEKWMGCVFYLRIFCMVYLLYPLQTANLNAIKAMGRSDLFLKLEIMKKAVGLTAMLATIFISVEVMTISFLVTTVISFLINSFPNRKLLKYTAREQILDILPNLALAGGMALVCFAVQFIGLSDILTLAIQVLLGVGLYVGGSILFKLDSFHYVLNLLKRFLKKRKKVQ